MVFPKKSRWNMIFLVLSGKMIFLFPQNMILPLRWKKKDLSQKIHKNIFSSNALIVFSKGLPLGHDLSWYWKMVFFSRKHDILFPGRKAGGDLFQEKHEKMKFSVYTYGCYKRDSVPLYRKKPKIILSQKNTPEGDWRSKLTF